MTTSILYARLGMANTATLQSLTVNTMRQNYLERFYISTPHGTKTVFCEFNHCTERLEHLATTVLVLPNEKDRFTLRELQENYFAPAEVSDLQYDECARMDLGGVLTNTYKRSLSGKLIFRINRYS